MTIVQIDLDRLNEALQFCQEQMKPMSARVALRMVQESIIPPAPPKDAPEAKKAVEVSAEALKELNKDADELERLLKEKEGETNG